MTARKTARRKAALIAAVLSATALVAGCVYEEPAYPSYAAAYPYPNYYGGYGGGYYDYGPTVGLGFRFGDHDWHEHHEWREHHRGW